MGRLAVASPDCAILVVSSSSDGNLILQALRAGAKEFLTQPLQIEDLLAALGRIGERRFGRGENRPRGSQVIAVAGAIGGVGTTSLAINLGSLLAQDPQNSVALVDLDLCLGDADVFLDTIPDYTLVDVAQNVTRLDFALLEAVVDQTFLGPVFAAAAGAVGRRFPDHSRRLAAGDRAAEGHFHAPRAWTCRRATPLWT